MSGAKVLIVEDESIIALDIQTSLQNAGYEVIAIATTSEEAILAVTEFQPNLVLMDIQLKSDRDGVETAEHIHQKFRLPIIFLTAHADEKTLTRAKATQPFGYILKPFEDRELVTAIEIALSRHQAEVSIEIALKKEREINELKSRFVSVVSHEFRNPLNAILFSTELLQRYNVQLSTQKRETYLQRIQASVKRMNQLLSDVLTISETESGKLQFRPQPIELVKFCQELVDELLISTDHRNPIQFSHHCTAALNRSIVVKAGIPTIISNSAASSLPHVDERLLHHILTNLLSNAIKYSPIKEPIDFQLTFDNQTAVFRIQDRGIGIPKSDRANLFQSFHRASNVRTIPGTGLGLSIVKQCVELHGGSIDVQSEEGAGTLFTVTLPLNKQFGHENNSSD